MKKISKLLSIGLLATIFLNSCNLNESSDDDIMSSSNEDTTEEVNYDYLVVYFSCTNNTETVAEKVQKSLHSDLEEIMPLIPYTTEDLNYNDDNSRANIEQNNPTSRPEIANDINISNAKTIFVGYPIWWGKLPKIIYTFFDTYDFNGKNIVPFATSGGSGIDTSVNEIKALEPHAVVFDGRRFSSSTNQETIDRWIESLNL